MLGLDAALVPSLADSRAAGRYRARRTVESREPGATRLRVDGRDVTAFCSNDYLGLADHPRVTEAFIEAARRWGVGSGAAHLVSGHCREHRLLEEALAVFTGRPRALLFSTGYMANLSVISALAGRGDRVLEDRLNHASLIDAGLASGARFARYAHCDPAALESSLGANSPGAARSSAKRNRLRANFRTLVSTDGVHGFGVLGATGGGSLEAAGLTAAEVPILMCTLGKARGVFGAFVAGSETLIETLIQRGRSY